MTVSTPTRPSTLDVLRAAAQRLRECVRELELIAVEDRPRRGDVHLVDVVANATFEVAGAAERAVRALPAGGPPAAVAASQAHAAALGAVLVRELAAPDRLAELAGLGDRYGREAGAWAAEVTRCVHACQCALWTDLQPALVAYWREKAGATNHHREPQRPPRPQPPQGKDNRDA